MPVVTRTEREMLPCELTYDELIERARSLAAAGQAVDREQATQTSLRAQMRSKMAELTGKRDMFNDIVASSKEYREVTVIETRDYDKGVITRAREDTGEIVESRPMVDDERQVPIDAVESTPNVEESSSDLVDDTEKPKWPIKNKAAQAKEENSVIKL